MSSFEEPTGKREGGLSRRRLFVRLGGGIAGLGLASLRLDGGHRAVASSGPISVRKLLRRISPQGCDPSHGIRVGLPNDHPVISLRDVARRYADKVVDHCAPLQLTVQNVATRDAANNSADYAHLTGANFTGAGMVMFQGEDAAGLNNFTTSLQAQPDGTFDTALYLRCPAPETAVTIRVTDVDTGRSAQGSLSYSCTPPPPSPPPPPPPAPMPPAITVTRQGSTFTVTGSGFVQNHAITLRVVDPQTFVGDTFLNYTTSDSAGKINTTISLPCPLSGRLAFSATDGRPNSRDATGFLWSTTATVACQ